MLERLQFGFFQFHFSPEETLCMPARNKGNVLRGALGTMLRQVCPPPEYAQLFEPAPPPDSPALSNFEAIPRPFVIRPPLEEKTRYERGESLEFGLVLVGRARESLPRFVQAFERLAEKGFGLNRARCRLHGVTPIADCGLRIADFRQAALVRFLTPTHLVFEERVVREPEFHHLVRRLRDRLNALATFYCGGPLMIEFKEIASRAEAVRCMRRDLRWIELSRRSSRTGRRHDIGGFTGECVFEAPDSGALCEFLPLLHYGQFLHVGKHTAWGNGWVELTPIRAAATWTPRGSP